MTRPPQLPPKTLSRNIYHDVSWHLWTKVSTFDTISAHPQPQTVLLIQTHCIHRPYMSFIAFLLYPKRKHICMYLIFSHRALQISSISTPSSCPKADTMTDWDILKCKRGKRWLLRKMLWKYSAQKNIYICVKTSLNTQTQRELDFWLGHFRVQDNYTSLCVWKELFSHEFIKKEKWTGWWGSRKLLAVCWNIFEKYGLCLECRCAILQNWNTDIHSFQRTVMNDGKSRNWEVAFWRT